MKIILLIVCLFLASCSSRDKKQTKQANGRIETLTATPEHVPGSEVLNLKSYYLSDVVRDSSDWLYGYNYKQHALDCFNLDTKTAVQLLFDVAGPSAVARPIFGLCVCARDSIWVLDASLKAVLLNADGEVLRSVPLSSTLSSGQSIIVEHNYAISVSDLHYDSARRSLLFGVRDGSTEPVSFLVREVFLDSDSVADHPLSASVEIPTVGDGGYANMNRPNITFAGNRVLFNYPVESHVYVLDLQNDKTTVYEADSRYTANKARPCSSKSDYAQWERHGVENPHFYEVRYLPQKDMYVRLHVSGEEFDATKDLGEQLAAKKLYLTLFDSHFNVIGEERLASCRYDLYTGWCITDEAVLLFVYNPLSVEESGEELAYDVIAW